jgi:RhoGAP domain
VDINEKDVLSVAISDKDRFTRDDYMGGLSIALDEFAQPGDYARSFSLNDLAKSGDLVCGEVELLLKVRRSDLADEPLVFGMPLVELMTRVRTRKAEAKVPPFFEAIVNELLARGAREELGILRISGSRRNIQKLRGRIDCWEDIDPTQVANIHDLTGLLKLWLRSLPEPLLLASNFDAVITAASSQAPNALMTEAMRLIPSLPVEHQAVLECLLSFLSELA